MDFITIVKSIFKAFCTLAEIFIKEASLNDKLRQDIDSMESDLLKLKIFLRNTASTNEVVMSLEEEVRDISIRVRTERERLTEGEEGQSSCGCLCFKTKRQIEFHDISRKVESLKNEKQKISTDVENFCNPTNSLPPPGRDIRQEPANQETVFILEDVTQALREQLVIRKQLVEKEASRRIISVCGMGGLGKTTLVHELYKSPEVTVMFPIRAWVSSSPSYENVLSTFTRNIGITNGSEMTRKVLDKNRYLLVIDDIRHSDINDLCDLWAAFPDNNKGSRVIITTRNKAVPFRAGHRDFIHELRFMTETESWDLFLLKFRKEIPTEKMEDLARKMVEKCGGLPLAITTLAKLLSYQRGLLDWIRISGSLWNHLVKEDEKNISGLLWDPNNREFSHQIRPCFLYMGMFPEGYEFNVEKLILLWMAEGFIEDGQDTMEFKEDLVNCSLIQVAGTFWEETLKFRVHDLLRFLAVEEARKLNLFAIFPYRDGTRDIISSKRHAIHSQFAKYISRKHPRLLTLISLCGQEPDFKIDKLLSRSKDFGSLLRLELMGINLSGRNMYIFCRHLSIIIKNLSSTLRFLGLTNTSITKIPSSIGNLKNLETLEAIGQELILLPEEISELKKLRHLRGKFYVTHIETLTALQTLCVLCIHSSSSLDLSRLAYLHELSVHFSIGSSSLDFICGLGELDTLSVSSPHPLPLFNPPPLSNPLPRCAKLTKLWLDGPITNIPNKDQFPPLLTRFILSETGFTDDPMPTLGLLPNLESLELIRSCTRDVTSFTVEGFTRLEVLRLSNMASLSALEVREGAMPRLNGLGIDGCPNLNVPDSLRNVPCVGKSASEDRIQQIRI